MRLFLSLVALGAVTRAATAENCEDKTITRKSIAKLTREARDAQVTLDVLVSRDDVVAASLSANARGNFGGSDAPQKWADVTTSGASLRCEGGEASQCSAWYDCGDASDATGAVQDGVLTAAVTISDAVEFDYCPNGGLAEVEVSVDFTVRRCESELPAPAPTPRPTPAAPPSAKRKKRSSAPAAFELTMAVLVLTVAGVGFLLACFCFDRARRAQDRRVDEIMKEADEINRKADAAVSSSRSSRSGDV
ncbi:unnamed protein product [Pelagomonas calceolata]|uniref:Uncharacterized protein n=1 Tax=Pelagomonas calceolata TaxID=35677 RepID=A0A8J2SIS6_9STRA|nr:unnamed protein product [Pelagomonas calceolata]